MQPLGTLFVPIVKNSFSCTQIRKNPEYIVIRVYYLTVLMEILTFVMIRSISPVLIFKLQLCIQELTKYFLVLNSSCFFVRPLYHKIYPLLYALSTSVNSQTKNNEYLIFAHFFTHSRDTGNMKSGISKATRHPPLPPPNEILVNYRVSILPVKGQRIPTSSP